MQEHELVSIAQQLIGRLREDDAEANARWLQLMVPHPADWFRLCFVLAAACPIDRPWSRLTEWTRYTGPDSPTAIARRRADLVDALAPKRRRSA
jgi:hypothetical protein